MVYLPHWHRAGIKQISDLFDEHENCFLPFLSLRNKYTLILATLLHPRRQNLYYNVQDVIRQTVNLRKSSSSHFRKKILIIGHRKKESKYIFFYPLRFTATEEVKLVMFQHKIIHNILATNSILYKMNKVASPSCPFSPSDSQNIRHLFISCPRASSFW